MTPDDQVQAARPAAKYAIRYRDGTELARRFPEPTAAYDDRGFLEAIVEACANAEHMEIVEVEDTA